MNKVANILAEAIWVRNNPSLTATKVGLVYKGDILKVLEVKEGWVKNEQGWITNKDNGIKLFALEEDTRTTVKPIKNPSKLIKTREASAEESNYNLYEFKYTDGVSEDTMKTFVKSARGIHGMPYQYMESVDERPAESQFGRKYTEKIVTKMPLLLLTPGKPKFLKGYNDKDKGNILSYLTTMGGKEDSTITGLLDREEGKMYSFEFDYVNYYKHVNPMCQKVARYLGIQDETIDSTKLDNYKWQNYTNSAFKNFVSNAECIAFYIDSESSISENFSNSTGESMLSGTTNGLSDLSREIQFLIGGASGAEFDALKKENYNATLEEVRKFTDKYVGFLPDRLMTNLTGGITTLASGGKMIFPEIWNDSNFSRSYNISIKLRTPDMDNYSWFMNIAVPMLHLIALVAPHQMGANGYQSPFLVRGYYKGFFNCDMGIITDMSIEKGDKGKWTAEGLPTEVDISFTIKDLYQILTITSSDNPIDLLNNTILLDYLANMCGINVNKPDLERSIDLFYNTIKNKVVDTVTFNGFLGLEQTLSNMVNSMFRN